MKLLRIWISVVSICAAQLACFGPSYTYLETTPIPISVEIPSIAIRGNKYSFVIMTTPNIMCYAGIGFWDTNEKWFFDQLSSKKADQNGICEWEWEIPSNAKNGEAVFKGFVENESQSTDFIPKKFCIEECP